MVRVSFWFMVASLDFYFVRVAGVLLRLRDSGVIDLVSCISVSHLFLMFARFVSRHAFNCRAFVMYRFTRARDNL